MARKQGFRRNAKTIGEILKTVDGGKREAAARIMGAMPADSGAELEIYTTDREVVGIVVRADKQAKDGIATKAASSVGMSPGNP
jgi:hypothetical protein